jgi:hypothetical protein
LYVGQRPSFIPKNKIVTKKELRHYNYLNSYVTPIVRAKEYLKLLKKEGLTQAQLAQMVGGIKSKDNPVFKPSETAQKETKLHLKTWKREIDH